MFPEGIEMLVQIGLKIFLIKWEQNHRAPGTYINNDWKMLKNINVKMTSNSKQKTDRKHKNTERRKTSFPKR